MNVLVTGGAGYIGSHAAMRLLEDGHEVTVVDNLSRGNAGAIGALQTIGEFCFVEADFGDRSVIGPLLQKRSIDVVMHFAAWTYVEESMTNPLRYFSNNTANALALLEAMDDAGVQRFVFSSTCATYGEPDAQYIPMNESCPQNPINPYGLSKLMVEQILQRHLDAKRAAGDDFAFAALRYFNVAGSDRRTRLGEDHDPETHLIPLCLDTALGQRESIAIYGTDYDTPDGTCVRDYVHVEDLVDAHVAVMQALQRGDGRAYNIGIGHGYSVREVIDACRRVTGIDFEVRQAPRRAGDPPTLFADPNKIATELNWSAQITDLDEIIDSAWQWRKRHPTGYAASEREPAGHTSK